MTAVIELVALVGILPLALVLFARLPPRRAMLATFLVGTLFLPVRGLDLPGPIGLEKQTTTSLSVLLAVLLFDARRLAAFRPGWMDLPLAAVVLSPIATSLLNGLGVWDGISVAITHALQWGIPWWMGRIYFRDRESLRELALALVIGGLVYVPLCWFEIRFSPQLHNWIYGYTPRPFMMVKRYGGFRPMLFMYSSLMVGMWMALTTVVAWWLWRSGSVRRLFGAPMGPLVLALAVTTVFCKTVGAISLMAIGCLAYEATRLTGSRLAIVGIALVGGLYGPLRAADVLRTPDILAVAEPLYDEERVYSLYIRLINEDAISQKALQRRLFGWGGYGRARAKPVEGRSIADGLWVITLGKYGAVGLAAVTLTYLMPALRVALLRRRRGLAGRGWAPALGLAMAGTLYWLDSLFNGFVNASLIVALGGAGGARLGARRRGRAVDRKSALPPAEEPPEASPEEPTPASLGRGLRGSGGGGPARGEGG